MRNVTIAVLFAVASVLGAQTPYLVEDINSTTTASPTSSSPRNFFRFGPRIYFAAFTSNTGEELWSTDGTEAGTSMVANILPGTSGSLPSRFTVLNGLLLFNASDQYGEELWATDGTAAGTRRIADIYTLSQSSGPGDRAVIDGKMIFAATDAVNGRELWITDGTPAGTRFFKDLVPGPESSSPRAFAQFNGAFYFGTATGLWKTDGTEAGTVLVKAGVTLNSITVAGPRIFFYGYSVDAGREPWVSDGTAAGTQRIVEINPGPEGVTLFGEVMTALGNRVLFGAYEPEHGSELWVTDGTAAGTQILRDVDPGSESGLLSSGGVVSNGAVALFAAHAPESGTEIWRTDGTPAGTTLLREFNPGPGSGSMGNLITVGSSFVFTTTTSVSTHFWTSDGTAAGTRETAAFAPRLLFGSRLTNIDGTLYFSAADSLHGYEPWKSDGTAAGTSMFANIGRDAAPSSEPGSFRVAGDWLYFNAWDGLVHDASDRNSFWRSDGTPEGTLKISEEILGGEPQVAVGRTLFFTRNYSELWMTGGTPESTKRATELERRFPQPPSLRFVLGDRILAYSDRMLWATTLAPGAPAVPLGSENGFGFVEVAGRAFYRMQDSSTTILWLTDATPGGTHVVKAFPEGIASALGAAGGHVYFITGGETPALWRSDGTGDGTTAVLELSKGSGELVTAGSQVFFLDNSGMLWVSDGTAAGTRQLPATPLSRYLLPFGKSVLFHQTVGTTHELWISDGTPEGTRELYDFGPGASTTYVTGYLSARGRVYFSAYTQATGNELWVTDGTAAGTKLVAELEPGVLGGSPFSLRQAGERIFFAASTSATGRELWALPLGSTPRLTIGDVRVAEAETTARFTVSLSSAAAQTVTVAFATANGTASTGSDYDAASGTLTFAAGETSKTIDVRVHADAAAENDETFLVALREPSGATIDTATAAGIIGDDDRTVDAGVTLDLSRLTSREVSIVMSNAGPGTATNLQPRLTSTPENYGASTCERCRFVSLAPGETALAFRRQPIGQQYFTATVSARENDPNPANDSVAWTMDGAMVMEGLDLAAGSQTRVWIASYFFSGPLSLESSNPAVLTVPASVHVGNEPVSFMVQGVAPGTATIRAFSAANTVETLVVNVVAPGTQRRWPGAVWTSVNAQYLSFHSQAVFRIFTTATAPFNGQTATGTVTLKANGVEVGRLTLKPGLQQQGHIAAHIPQFGKGNTFTVEYSGDANFLPSSETHEIEGARGHTTIEATAVRKGSSVIVRTHVTGSPMASPEGTVWTGSGALIPLTTIGPGIAAAEVTIPDVPESTTTLTVYYSGDPRYYGGQQGVRIRDERQRTVRH